jgi:Mg2+ and Co2+ transporter CorA
LTRFWTTFEPVPVSPAKRTRAATFRELKHLPDDVEAIERRERAHQEMRERVAGRTGQRIAYHVVDRIVDWHRLQGELNEIQYELEQIYGNAALLMIYRKHGVKCGRMSVVMVFAIDLGTTL